MSGDSDALAHFRLALFGTCEICGATRDARVTVLLDGTRRTDLYCPAGCPEVTRQP